MRNILHIRSDGNSFWWVFVLLGFRSIGISFFRSFVLTGFRSNGPNSDSWNVQQRRHDPRMGTLPLPVIPPMSNSKVCPRSKGSICRPTSEGGGTLPAPQWRLGVSSRRIIEMFLWMIYFYHRRIYHWATWAMAPPLWTAKKIVATRCQILRLKCTRFDFGWGSAPDPTSKAYSTPPDSLAGFKGDCVALLFVHPDITL